MSKYFVLEKDDKFVVCEILEFTSLFPNSFSTREEAEEMVKTKEQADEIAKDVERIFNEPSEGEGWKHAKYFDGTKWVDSWGEKK